MSEEVAEALTPDNRRAASYRRMREDIQSAFDHRSLRIDYDEKRDVLTALEFIDSVFSREQQPVGMDMYEYTFDELRKVGWLKLESNGGE
jgi:hypothetical protein